MKPFVLAAAGLAAGCLSPLPPSEFVYSDYTGMFQQTAGQFWEESAAAATGQWAWEPQSPTESLVLWGNPATWPPTYKERFIRDGDWVLLDGWYDNGTYYKLDVDQWVTDGPSNRTTLPSGAQRYARWAIPQVGESYRLFALGSITEQSSGNRVSFAHEQTWTNVGNVDNPYLGSAPAIRQTETWWDDNTTAFSKKLHRDVYLAQGFGMAFKVTNYDVSSGTETSTTYLRYTWNW